MYGGLTKRNPPNVIELNIRADQLTLALMTDQTPLMARVRGLVFRYKSGAAGMPLIGRRARDGLSPNDNKNQTPDTGLRHHRGVLCFAYFYLDKQMKVTCCRATPDLNPISRQRFNIKQ